MPTDSLIKKSIELVIIPIIPARLAYEVLTLLSDTFSEFLINFLTKKFENIKSSQFYFY